jgi:uncharacterized protein YyaL (SSP411 family)
MLYDNAQLARVYLHAWQITGTPLFRAVAEEILDYVAREMTDPAGGFYSAQDADSEGEEGKFFLWTPAEIEMTLGAAAPAFMAAYDVTPDGNFEGKNILTFVADLASRPGFADDRRRLCNRREERVRPGRDDKVLVSWNGLMLAAFAEAARALEREDYRQVAERNAAFLLHDLRGAAGRLLHTWRAGVAKGNGYLDDYSHLIEGLLELYQSTSDDRWYTAAHALTEEMIAHFRADAGFFDTSDDHEALIVRTRQTQDNAVPSGSAMAAYALLRLAGVAVEPRYLDLAQQSIAQVAPLLARHPLGFAQWLFALDYALARPREIAIVGSPAAADAQALLAACRGGYRPHQFAVIGQEGVVPLFANRGQVDGRATAYVCSGFTCLPPVTELADLAG